MKIRKSVFALYALFALSAAGCSGGSTEVTVQPAVITGVVRDTLAQRGIPDMLVVLGDSFTITEADGSFELPVRVGMAGTLAIVGDNPLYGGLTRQVSVTADQSLGAMYPMRNAPYVSDFAVLANGDIEATISHQAGAAAARRPETWLVFNHGLPNQSSTYPSTWWNWTQTGPRSWRVHLPLAQPGIQNAFFNLYGPNGIPTPALCEAATGQCENDSF